MASMSMLIYPESPEEFELNYVVQWTYWRDAFQMETKRFQSSVFNLKIIDCFCAGKNSNRKSLMPKVVVSFINSVFMTSCTSYANP